MAEATIIGAAIGSIADVLLTKAISTLEEQINLAWDFKDELNKLRASLALTQAFLQDAVSRQLDGPLEVWLEQLRDIASEADDVLDELAYEHLRVNVEDNQMKRKVKNFFSLSKNRAVFNFNMAKKVRKILQSMDDINDRASKYGLQQSLSATASTGVGNQTHKFVESSKVIGRDDDVVKVANLLTSSTSRQPFSIVSIVGMAGMGKTTLAQLVLKNELVRNRFNKMIWVCVAENFDVQIILQKMVEFLFGEPCQLKDKNVMLEKLKTGLGGKSYLLVLDDVWDVNFQNWEDLRDSLLGINEDNEGSSILVTTRTEDVALVRETFPENRYYLKALADDQCWSLMKRRAFTNSSISPELEVIGREIARKCKGVPLVATVIGGTMCNKMDKDEWMSIRDSSLWGSLERNEAILRVLKLSYDRLPSTSLKQCFVYCSIFPKDFCIQKEILIQLWMAEGFLQQSKRNSMVVDEDIGDEYFMNLLSNSLLQDVELHEYGCISTCKMHDLVHDLTRSISEVQILTPMIDSTHDIHKYKDDDSKENIVDIDMKLWHSLFLKTDANHVAGNFNGLRVLNFCDADIYSLPDSIGGLKHLRYFDISRTRIRTIPKSLTKLYHLQTLRLLMCRFLIKLPKGMKNLVSLRHLYITYSFQLSAEIACLTSLKTLPIFDVVECAIGDLGNLSALGGELELSNLQNVRNKEEAREAKLWEKKKIHKLVYRWQLMPWVNIDENKDEEVLDGLEPHSSLKSLTIDCYKGRQCPSWFGGMGICGSFSNMVELNLLHCENLKSLPTLGQYCNLKFLRIESLKKVKCIGNEFYHSSDQNKTSKLFPSLEVLTLKNMRELEEWLEVEAAVFPSLKDLEIRDCPKLNSIPKVSRFSSLERLILFNCRKLRWSEDGPFLFPSTLRKLTMAICSNLNIIPSVEGGISSLQELRITNCEKLSAIEEGLLMSTVLRDVHISSCPSLISNFFNGGSQSLVKLEIQDCDELQEITGKFFSLESLHLNNCSKFSWSENGPFVFPSTLRKLRIESCSSLNCIPSVEDGISSLQDLYVENCDKLSAIEEGLLASTVLRAVCIRGYPSLTSISFNGGSRSLVEFNIVNCANLVSISSTEGFCLLSILRIVGCKELVSLPSWLQTCTSLVDLRIRDCSNLKSIAEDTLGALTSLKMLDLGEFSEELEEFPDISAVQYSSVEYLRLSGWRKLNSLPHQLQHLTALKDLTIERFHGMKALPEWLGNLTSLQRLDIDDCENLMHLPSKEAMQCLSSLNLVLVRNCPLLENNHIERSKIPRIADDRWWKNSPYLFNKAI